MTAAPELVLASPMPPERPPVIAYLLMTSLWLSAVVALELTERVQALGPFEIVALGLAAHQLSRVIAKERIAYPLRRLFTEDDGETPRRGWARAPGQLVTCHYCASVWSATFLLASSIDALVYLLAIAGVATLAHAWRDKDA